MDLDLWEIAWDEDLHPRDEHGRFTEAGSGRTVTPDNVDDFDQEDLFSGLSEEDEDAVSFWTGQTSGESTEGFQHDLRVGKPLGEQGQKLLKAISKLPAFEGTVYRNESFEHKENFQNALEHLKPGAEITHREFVASGYDQDEVEEEFPIGVSEHWPYGISYEMESKSGRVIGGDESEVLFPPGTRFRVDSVEKQEDPKLYSVKLTEVGRSTKLQQMAWDPDEHPRDEHGRFTESGAEGKELTGEEKEAIQNYTGAGFAWINTSLRSGTPISEVKGAKELLSGLSKLAPVSTQVYRGEYFASRAMAKEALAALKPGAVVSQREFLSTSARVDTAEKFLGKSKVGVLYTIQSKSGRPLGELGYSREKEVTFLPHTRFEVVSVKWGTRTVGMTSTASGWRAKEAPVASVKLREVDDRVSKMAWDSDEHPRDEHGRFAESGSGSEKEEITREDHQNISFYTLQGYTSVNQNLRNGVALNKVQYAPELLKSVSKLPPAPGRSYRGEWYVSKIMADKTLKGLTPGKEITQREFLSTSKTAGTMEKFLARGKVGIRYVINGSSGRDITKYSAWQKENEVLYTPHTRFRVDSVEWGKQKVPKYSPEGPKRVFRESFREIPVATVKLTEIERESVQKVWTEAAREAAREARQSKFVGNFASKPESPFYHQKTVSYGGRVYLVPVGAQHSQMLDQIPNLKPQDKFNMEQGDEPKEYGYLDHTGAIRSKGEMERWMRQYTSAHGVPSGGKIEYGEKSVEAVDLWKVDWDPEKHPRVPAGSPTGGEFGLSTEGWTKTGGQRGSNPGGLYKAPDGKQYYAKFYRDPNQARSEKVAQEALRQVGAWAPTGHMVQLEGKTALANEWEGKINMYPQRGDMRDLVKDNPEQAGKVFGASVVTQNWDVVGLEYDNLVSVGGKLGCVDTGGSFQFRAQGAPKPFTTDAKEIRGLTDSSINPQSAAIFKGMTKDPEFTKGAHAAVTELRGWYKGNAPGVSKAQFQQKCDAVDREIQKWPGFRKFLNLWDLFKDWDEELHPRDEHGRFVTSGGGKHEETPGYSEEHTGARVEMAPGEAEKPPQEVQEMQEEEAGRFSNPDYPGKTEAQILKEGKEACHFYQGEGYAYINDLLREGKSAKDVDNTRQLVEYLEKGVPAFQGTVFRGEVYKTARDLPFKLEVGRQITSPAFLSTSKNPGVAQGFAASGVTKIGVVYHIQSETGRDIEKYGQLHIGSKEQEVLYPPGARFEITEVHEFREAGAAVYDRKVYEVSMKEVPYWMHKSEVTDLWQMTIPAESQPMT